MTDPYKRPFLQVITDLNSEVTYEGATAYRGTMQVEGIEHEPIHHIVRKDARHISGLCFGEVKLTNRTQVPCLWLHWGDPDGVEDHQIHSGNFPAESTGCPLPGLEVTDSGVGHSQDALGLLFQSLVAAAGYPAPDGTIWSDVDPEHIGYQSPPFGLVVVVEFVAKEAPEPVKPPAKSCWQSISGGRTKEPTQRR